MTESKYPGWIEWIEGQEVGLCYEDVCGRRHCWGTRLDTVPFDLREVGAMFRLLDGRRDWCRERWTQEEIDRAQEAGAEMFAALAEDEES
jgi:hypothetical protein